MNTSDSGIIPPLINSAIYGICGNCSEFGEPRIFFDNGIDGSSLRKIGLVKVKQDIDDNHQINFPIIGRKDSNIFVPVIDSPGSVFITKKPSLTMTVEYMFFDTIIGTLPLLGFAVVTASLAGLIMWCLVSYGENYVWDFKFKMVGLTAILSHISVDLMCVFIHCRKVRKTRNIFQNVLVVVLRKGFGWRLFQ